MSYERITSATVFRMEPDEPCDVEGCDKPHTHLIVYQTSEGEILIQVRCDEHFETLSIGSPLLPETPNPCAN